MNLPKKRKSEEINVGDGNNDVSKSKMKKKKGSLKSQNGKPPTVEEMSQLRETEYLFHSNLFHLQLTEMLNEVKLKEPQADAVEMWLKQFIEFIANVKFPLNVKLTEECSLREQVVRCVKSDEELSVIPRTVNIVGSFAIDCAVRPSVDIDLIVELPKKLFHKEDYLNEIYTRKKLFYMYYLEYQLSEKMWAGLEYSFVFTHSKDCVRLLIKPNEKPTNIYIHMVPERFTFKDARFLPDHNNIRYSWFFNKQTAESGALNTPTPYYNAVIGQDVVMLRNEELCKDVFGKNENLKEAFILLKIWLHQRGLNKGVGSFANHIMKMFLVHLYKNRKINALMSSYHLIRIAWLTLSESNWNEEGISLVDGKSADPNRPPLAMFHQYYDVVFLDSTGYVNMAAFLNLYTYIRVRNECKLAIEMLNSGDTDSFTALFVTPVSFCEQYDHIIRIDDAAEICNVTNAYLPARHKLDYRNARMVAFVNIVLPPVIKDGLTDRVDEIAFELLPSAVTWQPSDQQLPGPDNEILLIGLKLNHANAYRVIDKGPSANLPEAKGFRSFWGEVCKLRRFKDGTVREAVVWADPSWCLRRKRLIVKDIIGHLLSDKFSITEDKYAYVAHQMEEHVLRNPLATEEYGTGEEAAVKVHKSFAELSSLLYEMEDGLPLQIISVQGTSSVFRYTDPFPPLPYVILQQQEKEKVVGKKHKRKRKRNNAVVECKELVPSYFPPIQGIIQFTASGKWPDDEEAIRRMKAAFYVALAGKVSSDYNLKSQPYPNHVDILKDGYVFRLKIFHGGELTCTRRHVSEDGFVKYADTEQSLEFARVHINLPALTSALHGLHEQYPSYGATCCLAKRWLSSCMITYQQMPEVSVDLLVAYLFLKPQPLTVAFQPQTMFIRFLRLLSNTNWCAEIILVNFNNKLTKDEITAIESEMGKNRSTLPPMIMVTPFDKSGTLWTASEPTLPVLAHIAKLADAALSYFQHSVVSPRSILNIKALFQHSVKNYDIIIRLNRSIDPLRHLRLKEAGERIEGVKLVCTALNDIPPVVGFHPVTCYLKELQRYYARYCEFFCDTYGGDTIGVLLKPSANETLDFKIANMTGCVVTENQRELKFNKDALINELRVLGKGIVESVVINKIR